MVEEFLVFLYLLFFPKAFYPSAVKNGNIGRGLKRLLLYTCFLSFIQSCSWTCSGTCNYLTNFCFPLMVAMKTKSELIQTGLYFAENHSCQPVCLFGVWALI